MSKDKLRQISEKIQLNSAYGKVEYKRDLTPKQLEAYEALIKTANDLLPCEVECNALINDIDTLTESMKVKHYQLGDIVYFYDVIKNTIEKLKIDSIWLQPDGNIVYNTRYYGCHLKDTLEQCKAYALLILKMDYEKNIEKIKLV